MSTLCRVVEEDSKAKQGRRDPLGRRENLIASVPQSRVSCVGDIMAECTATPHTSVNWQALAYDKCLVNFGLIIIATPGVRIISRYEFLSL